MITLDLSILNQKGTPMFNSDIFANRPAAGVVGRIFISTDTKVFYRDTGTTWELVGGSGSGTITGSGTAGTLPIWTSSSALGDSSLLEGASKISTIKDIQADGYYLTGMTGGSGALYWTSDRVTLANYNVGGIVHIEVNGGIASTIFGTDLSLTNYGYIAATPTLTAANNVSSLASYGINTLSYAAGFSSNNIGALYGGIAGFNLQTFAGSATFAQANVASGGASVNSIDFSSAGSTITMTQSSGIRVMSGQQNLFQYQGTNSGTITHAAISQNTGFYRPSGASGTLTITNAYSHLINALDDYGAGFSFTNRWGIYQAGASDKNYFAANMLLGITSDNGNRLQVNGISNFTDNILLSAGKYLGFSSTAYITPEDNISGARIVTPGVLSIATGGTSVKATINALGNFGLGIVSPAWGTSTIGLDIGAWASFAAVGGSSFMGFNVYATSTIAYAYKNTGAIALGYQQTSVSHNWYTAPSGTAGNPITFTQAMTLNSSGNLLVGTSVDNGEKCQINGSTLIRGTLQVFNGGANGYIQMQSGSGGSSGYLEIYNTTTRLGYIGFSSSNLLFTAEGSANFEFSSNGNLLIGTGSNPGQKLYLNGSLRIDGQTSGTAGGNSGQHLIINCDGTTYKIALLNP